MNSPEAVNVPEFVKGQVSAYCYMVERGKLAAEVPVQNRYIEELQHYVCEKHGLKTYAIEFYSGWTDLWIYEKPYVLELIRTTSSKPKSVFDHWVLGKLFGFSDSAIEEFLRS